MFDRRSVKLMFRKYHVEFILSLFSRFRSLAWICNIVCALLLLFTVLVFAYLPISQVIPRPPLLARTSGSRMLLKRMIKRSCLGRTHKNKKDNQTWPSDRFSSCPKFRELSKKDKADLLEKHKSCARCLSWTHAKDSEDCKPPKSSCP